MQVKRQESVGGGSGASLMKVCVNKVTLLSEVSVATVRKRKSNVKGLWVEGEVYHTSPSTHTLVLIKVIKNKSQEKNNLC